MHSFAQDGWFKLPPSQKRDFPLAFTGAELYSGCLQPPVLTQRTVMNSEKCKFPCPFLSSLYSLIMTTYLEKNIYSSTKGQFATPMFAHTPCREVFGVGIAQCIPDARCCSSFSSSIQRKSWGHVCLPMGHSPFLYLYLLVMRWFSHFIKAAYTWIEIQKSPQLLENQDYKKQGRGFGTG